jgi:hypothetical protein
VLTPFQLPYQAGWQDLKDLFRAAGNIIRADINIGADGRPKGSGTVVFETPKDAQQAICMYFCPSQSFISVVIMSIPQQLCTMVLIGMVVYSKFER